MPQLVFARNEVTRCTGQHSYDVPLERAVVCAEKLSCSAFVLPLSSCFRMRGPPGEQLFRSFQFAASACAQTSSRAIDEVREHAHTGTRSFGRDLSGREHSRDRAGIFGEESCRRMR